MTITVFHKNLITNQISTHPKRNNDFEIEIINNFTTKLSSTPFSEARTTAIEQIITQPGQTLNQETINNIGRIKQTYFTGNPEVLNDVNFSTLLQNNNQSLNFTKEFIRFTDYIVKTMTNTDFNTFLELLENYELLTLMAIVPSVILSIGTTCFTKNFNCYFSHNKYLNLLKTIKNSGLFNKITTIINFSIQKFKLYIFTSLTVGTAIIVIPKLILSKKSNNNILPIIKADRIGGDTSKMLDTLSVYLHKFGSELGLLSSSFPSGFMSGSFEKFSVTLNNLLGYKSNK